MMATPTLLELMQYALSKQINTPEIMTPYDKQLIVDIQFMLCTMEMDERTWEEYCMAWGYEDSARRFSS